MGTLYSRAISYTRSVVGKSVRSEGTSQRKSEVSVSAALGFSEYCASFSCASKPERVPGAAVLTKDFPKGSGQTQRKSKARL